MNKPTKESVLACIDRECNTAGAIYREHGIPLSSKLGWDNCRQVDCILQNLRRHGVIRFDHLRRYWMRICDTRHDPEED